MLNVVTVIFFYNIYTKYDLCIVYLNEESISINYTCE